MSRIFCWWHVIGRHNFTENNITTADDLIADILDSRKRGYFVTRGEIVTDVWAVSAFLNVNSETLAVAVAGLRHRMESKVIDTLNSCCRPAA